MSKVIVKRIETCHDCPKLLKSNEGFTMKFSYDDKPPKTFKYLCQRWSDKNHSYFEKALTTSELMETCPLSGYEDVIKDEFTI